MSHEYAGGVPSAGSLIIKPAEASTRPAPSARPSSARIVRSTSQPAAGTRAPRPASAAATMRGKGTTTRLKQPERAQAPPHGEQSSAFRETNHSIDASSWIFTSQHDSLVKGLHKSAPPDLQVWARRRRQAARKAQIPTKKPVTRTRSPLLRPPPCVG